MRRLPSWLLQWPGRLPPGWAARARLLVLVAAGAALGSAIYGYGLRVTGLSPQVPAEEAARLRKENLRLVTENGRLQGGLDAVEGQLTIERAAREQLAADLLSAQRENGELRSELAFFEELIPPDPSRAQIGIRSAELTREGSLLRYRVLLMRAGRPANEFRGQLQFSATGERDGASETVSLQPFEPAAPAGAMPMPRIDRLAVRMRQYQRAEGSLAIPPRLVLRSVVVRVLEEGEVRAESIVHLPGD